MTAAYAIAIWAMTVAPMAMAAISSVPPTINQRIGPPRKTDAILKDVVPVEAIGRDRYREMNFRSRSSHNPRVHDFDTAAKWN